MFAIHSLSRGRQKSTQIKYCLELFSLTGDEADICGTGQELAVFKFVKFIRLFQNGLAYTEGCYGVSSPVSYRTLRFAFGKLKISPCFLFLKWVKYFED